MNKHELIQAITDKSSLNKAEAKTALDTILTVIEDTLANGDEIALIGFGTFSVREHQARTGRNPQTGEKLTIPAKKVPTFKAGKWLKEAVQGV